MTSELAKKIQERIYNIANDRKGEWGEARASLVRDVSFWFSDGKFDDLLAPEGRPMLSGPTVDLLIEKATDALNIRLHQDDDIESVPTNIVDMLRLYASNCMDGANGVRHEIASNEIQQWEAYAEKRKAGR